MDITTVNFIVFFLVCIGLYYCVGDRYKNIFLLIASYIFYSQSLPQYLFILIVSGLVIYIDGLLIEKIARKNAKIALGTGILFLVIELVLFKYIMFISNLLRNRLGVNLHIPFAIIQPLGISFFVLQSISYLIDVWRGDIKADKNLVNVLLYTSFFPFILSGPIQKGKEFIPQLQKHKKFNIKQVEYGIILMSWGYFQKLVISNRLALVANHIFENYNVYSGVILIFGAIVFGIQLYIDFSGYSDIAIGMANTFGMNLKKNFQFPYTAQTIAEFWRRWHISLSSWLKEYVYFPLGGNRRGQMRKYFNILVVFCVSGIWHGTGINYLIWGGLHGIYQILGGITGGVREKIRISLGIDEDSELYKIFRMGIVFLLVDFAWIFFKAPGTHAALIFISRIFPLQLENLFNGTLLQLGLTNIDWYICIFALFMFEILHYFRKHTDIWLFLDKQWIGFRWTLYYALIFSVILFGIYGSNSVSAPFNYFQF